MSVTSTVAPATTSEGPGVISVRLSKRRKSDFDIGDECSPGSPKTRKASPELATPAAKAAWSAETPPPAPVTSEQKRHKSETCPLNPRPRSAAGAERMLRCGSCENCLRRDCGCCANCMDMSKYGGPGVKKQACLNRKCLNTVTTGASGGPRRVATNLSRLPIWSTTTSADAADHFDFGGLEQLPEQPEEEAADGVGIKEELTMIGQSRPQLPVELSPLAKAKAAGEELELLPLLPGCDPFVSLMNEELGLPTESGLAELLVCGPTPSGLESPESVCEMLI